MRERIGLLFSSLLFAACSGTYGAADQEQPAASPEQAAPPVQGTPSESELTEEQGVFVVAGKLDGDGTRARPFGTLKEALEVAKITKKRVFACAGVFREQLVVEGGVSMIGGLDCSEPVWTLGTGRSTVESPASPAMIAREIATATRIERFDVVAPSATEPGGSSIGLLATDSPALTIVDASIVAQDGAAGADGVRGIQLVQKGMLNGYDFDPHRYVGGVFGNPMPAPTPGPTSICEGEPGHDGETGGYGGSGGLWEWGIRQDFVEGWYPYLNNSDHRGQPGQTKSGAAGKAGVDGPSAKAIGWFSREGYTPRAGARGTNGEPGKGGSGGWGMNPLLGKPSPAMPYAAGIGGGSGGAGGCPGLAGTPGGGGGASVGVLLFASPLVLERVTIASQDGGAGGRGAFGSSPTPGGAGGRGVTGYPATAASRGGDGGRAGVSGHGAGGPSIALVHDGSTPEMTDVTLKHGRGGAGQPATSEGGQTIGSSVAGEATPELVVLSFPTRRL